MSLQIYNSLTRKKEIFKPVVKGKVKMYVCGMTVYSDAHIGHARTYLAFDIIRRYFEYNGYAVTYIQNITDVDDKIIMAANKVGVDPLEYSRRFADICLHDLDDLGIRRADKYPKASETIPDMIEMIKQIIDRGYGYAADGDVYFSVEAFPSYGKLSGQQSDEMKAGARIEPGEKKRSPLDFALWKASKPGEPSWESPWGNGRPGWHIECSAMSSKYLGLPFDIHGGGMDLRFPHHENEIAQAEAATGKSFARYWMHIGLLTVNGEKMSKSLGNIINVKDLLQRWNAEVIRFFYAQTHYRGPPDFSEKALQDTAKGLDRIHRVYEALEVCAGDTTKSVDDGASLNTNEKQYHSQIERFKKQFQKAMDDDFNTPQAIATMFEFVNDSNRFLDETRTPNPQLCSSAFKTLQKFGRVLTLFQDETSKKDEVDDVVIAKLQNVLKQFKGDSTATQASELLDRLLGVREQARKDKDWKTADAIRDELEILGFEIQDTVHGPVWRKK
jgi:cysteinyl-tRNA synthetase